MFIKVKVTAGARAEKVVKKRDDLFAVSVKEEAERGAANERVLELLKREYPGKRLKIVSGHLKPGKIIEIGE